MIIRILLVSLFAFISYGFGDEFEELSKTFSEQVEKGVGILPDLPSSTLPLRRCGDIKQKLFFEDHSQCTLILSFSYKDQKGQDQSAKLQRRFFLRDFKGGGGKRFEVDHKLMTLSFQDSLTKWHIGFRSSTELTRAASLFSKIIEISTPPTNDLTSISQTAKEAGFHSLIVSPIGPTIPSMAKSLFSNDTKSQYIAFLSRATIDQTEQLLRESENRLPLFVYDLQNLDKSSFYSIPSCYETKYNSFSSPKIVMQSALSDDLLSLKEDLKMKEVCYIHFVNKPSLKNPIALLYPQSEADLWNKAIKSHKVDPKNINCIFVTPLYWNDTIPLGTESYWLLSTTPRSDDTLRFWFAKGSFSSRGLMYSFIEQNYPHLKKLLQQPSSSWKGHTIQETIERNFQKIEPLLPLLSKTQTKVLKIVLLTHEIGACFGTDEELSYTSFPFTLMLAEKVGCSDEEMTMLELVLEQKFLPSKETNLALSLQDLFHTVQKLKNHHVASTDYCVLQQILVPFLVSVDQTEQSHPLRTNEILTSLCLGQYTPPISRRRIYSSYMWEVRDPLHRDGLYLKKLREKFELHLLEKPDSPWKGKFWQWIEENQKRSACPTLYLTEEQKKTYKPIFKNGKLYLQDGSLVASKEVMYVIDTDNQLYIGEKKDGKAEGELSFSHASFTAGKPVVSSGKLRTDAEGRPVLVRNMSGHYRPKILEMVLALQALAKEGIPLSSVLVSIKGDSVTELPKMKGDLFLKTYESLTLNKKSSTSL